MAAMVKKVLSITGNGVQVLWFLEKRYNFFEHLYDYFLIEYRHGARTERKIPREVGEAMMEGLVA